MATRGALGGLAEAALQTALLMDAAGKDDVFLETVGVGQAEVDVIDHADSVVLVLIPGSGDSIQALKAGVMEIPDIIVVNKADHPLTDTMVREIRGVLSLAPQEGWRVPIVKTEAPRGEGVETLAEKLAEHRAFVESEGTLSERRRRNLLNEVLGIATVRLRRALEATLRDDPEVQALLDEVVARRLDPASAASAILARGRDRPRGGRASRRGMSRSSSSRCKRARRALESRHAEGVPFACLRRGLRRGAVRPCRRGHDERAARGGRRRPPGHAQPQRQRAARVAGARRGPDHRAGLLARRQPARVHQGGRVVGARPRHRAAPLTLTSGEGGATNPGWSLDGTTLAFRRGLLVYRVPAAGGTPQPDLGGLDRGHDRDRLDAGRARSSRRSSAGLLLLPGSSCRPP